MVEYAYVPDLKIRAEITGHLKVYDYRTKLQMAALAFFSVDKLQTEMWPNINGVHSVNSVLKLCLMTFIWS